MFRPRERAFKQFKCPRPQCVKGQMIISHEKRPRRRDLHTIVIRTQRRRFFQSHVSARRTTSERTAPTHARNLQSDLLVGKTACIYGIQKFMAVHITARLWVKVNPVRIHSAYLFKIYFSRNVRTVAKRVD